MLPPGAQILFGTPKCISENISSLVMKGRVGQATVRNQRRKIGDMQWCAKTSARPHRKHVDIK